MFSVRPRPDVEPAVLQLDHGIHRLERRVCKIWHFILGLEHASNLQRRLHIAVILEPAVLAFRREGRSDRLEHGRAG